MLLPFLWNALVLLAVTSPRGPYAVEAAQAADEPSGWRVTSNEPNEAGFDPTYLISDDEFVDTAALSLAQIEALLRKTPFHNASCLASYLDEDGVSAARSIADAAAAHAISPVVLLARIQTEKSLLAKARCSESSLRTAFGYACPDDAPCDARFEGFRQQVWLGAQALRDYLTELDRDGRTRTGWEVGRPKRTKDGVFVTTRNRATAALYTYTPWVGTSDVEAREGGKRRRRPFGNFLFWASLAKLAPEAEAAPPLAFLGWWPAAPSPRAPAHPLLPSRTAQRAWVDAPAR